LTVVWLPVALEQIRRIKVLRNQLSDGAGDRIASAILDRGDQLERFPRSGRTMPEFQMEHLREIQEREFRICYEVLPDRIEVFGVVSSRQDLRED
jgi:plasmid stabilization system protein ParE